MLVCFMWNLCIMHPWLTIILSNISKVLVTPQVKIVKDRRRKTNQRIINYVYPSFSVVMIWLDSTLLNFYYYILTQLDFTWLEPQYWLNLTVPLYWLDLTWLEPLYWLDLTQHLLSTRLDSSSFVTRRIDSICDSTTHRLDSICDSTTCWLGLDRLDSITTLPFITIRRHHCILQQWKPSRTCTR